MLPRVGAVLVVLALVTASCGSGTDGTDERIAEAPEPEASAAPTATPAPPSDPPDDPLEALVLDEAEAPLGLEIVPGESGRVTIDLLPADSVLRGLLEDSGVVEAYAAVYASDDGEETIIKAAIEFDSAEGAAAVMAQVATELGDPGGQGSGRSGGLLGAARAFFAVAAGGYDLFDACVRFDRFDVEDSVITVWVDVSGCHAGDLPPQQFALGCPAVLQAGAVGTASLRVPTHIHPFVWSADPTTVRWDVTGPLTIAPGAVGEVVEADLSAAAALGDDRAAEAAVEVEFERFADVELWGTFRLNGGKVTGSCTVRVVDDAAPVAVAGTWEFTVDVTETSGACVDEPPYSYVLIVEQDGAVATVTGLPGQEEPWEATVAADTLTFGGSRADDGGTTNARFSMTVDGDTMTGAEDWSWESRSGSCPFGRSTVTAQRE